MMNTTRTANFSIALLRTPVMAAVVTAAIAASILWPAFGEATTLKVEQHAPYGAYVTDAEGRALYLFTADRRAAGAGDAESRCYDACAQAWPPLLADDGRVSASERVRQEMIGTTRRKGGATQVTYNGWPLYYFVKDRGAGAATGQDVHGFGGEWYLLTPQGQKVEVTK